MSVRLIYLYRGQPGTSDTVLYTCPANCEVEIISAVATNVNAAAKYFVVQLVTSEQGEADSYIAVPQTSLDQYESYLCPELIGQVLNAGDYLSALQETASAINLIISAIKTTIK